VFKLRMRVLLILVFGGFLMVSTRLFYLQMVLGAHYREYAENVRVEQRWTEASRGTIRANGGELLAFDQPGFNVAITPCELPEWRALCQPILKLYTLARRERIASVRDVSVMVRPRPRRWLRGELRRRRHVLRQQGTDLVERDEHGTALVVVPRAAGAAVDAAAEATKTSAADILRALFEGLASSAAAGSASMTHASGRDVGIWPPPRSRPTRPLPWLQRGSHRAPQLPIRHLAAHILGYVQPVSVAEYDRWHTSYSGSEPKRFLPTT